MVTVWALLAGRTTAAVGASARAPAATSATPITGTRQVLHVPVPGDAGATRAVYVYRPDVPDSADLPVLYFLHGYPGSASESFTAGLPRIIADMVAAGSPPFVFVAPDGNGLFHSDTEWANATDGRDQFETFVTTNVIDAVEGTHRRDRSRRAIAGFSMGGYGAMNLASHHPDLFGQVVPIGGYFHVDDTSNVFQHQLAAIDANTPELHLADARRERILIVDGDQGNDRVVKGESKLFYQQLVEARVPASYEQIPGDHSWSFVAAAFPDVVRFLDAEWSSEQPPVPEPVRDGQTQGIGRWTGKVSGARVRVSLLAARDPRRSQLDALRTELGAPPASYVLVTLTNPTTASRPVSIFKVSFVATSGTTIDANPATAVLDEWRTTATRGVRGVGTATRRAAPRPAPQAAALVTATRLAHSMRDETVVAPGQTKTAVLVTTAVLHKVGLVFVGDSYAVGSLDASP